MAYRDAAKSRREVRRKRGNRREKKGKKGAEVVRTTEGPRFAIVARLLLEKTHLHHQI